MRQAAWLLGLLWLAGVLQAGVSSHMAILGVGPDFLLLFSLMSSLFTTRRTAAMLGFGAGVVGGALVGANLTHYIVSRAFSAFLASWSRRLRFEMSYPVIAATVFIGTMFARVLFMFTAAPRDVGGFLGATIAEATYNGVLALPLYGLVKRVVPTTSRRRI